ncbi:hypothetical protein PUN28_017976 [Cardiocondyla obscurior]|uniref:Secreted protein n=1 Tax=Cardiocondyla obscurior TaxID=286306 RepID=A0AAW2EF95_9HYME
MLGQSWLLAYIFAFLSSDAWSGTVNYMTSSNRTFPDKEDYNTFETYLPAVNNIDVPGCRRVMLVLIDETSQNCPANINIPTLAQAPCIVPMWRGRGELQGESLANAWNSFWCTANIANARRDTLCAFNEVSGLLGVSDCVGTSLSLVAELYGVWYQGIAPDQHHGRPGPDYLQAPYGNLFNVNRHDQLDARRRTVGYNFSSVSPNHISPTGIVRIRYVGEGAGGNVIVTWHKQSPNHVVPSYNIQTMTPVMRIASSLGLVLTNPANTKFSSPNGLTHWVHMLSCAVSFSMSVFLTSNDITPKNWNGLYNKYDTAHRDMVVDTLKTKKTFLKIW